MNIYLTSGTYDYLYKKYEKKLSSEVMLLMQETDNDRAILLHESSSLSIFQEPRIYEVLFSRGMLHNKGFVTLNYIPVSEEKKPIFEYNIKDYLHSLNESNIQAIRFLRPRKGDIYIIFCLWEDKSQYITWKHNPQNTDSLIGKNSDQTWNSSQHSLFNGKPYFISLTIPEEKKH